MLSSGGAAAGFGLDDLTRVLLIGTLVLVAAIAAVRISARSGFPSLLLYLAIGVALGENGLGIAFDSASLTQVLGYSALILILAEGGLSTSWSSIKPSVAPAVVLSTLGVVVSVAVVAVACRLLLHIDWDEAMLVGAILASTDAAAVFSVLRRVPLPSRVTGMLEAESGFNDAPVVLLVTALAERTTGAAGGSWWELGIVATLELIGGAAIGIAVGYLGGHLMKRFAGGSSGLFSIGVMAVTVLAYAAAATAHTSGFMACYVSALVLGNLRLPHQSAVHGFSQGLGWLAQIGLFVLLGLLATPSGMADQIVPAIVIGLVLLLVARPLAVHLSLTPFRIPFRTQAFMSWAGLRGAVPVVLATVPITLGSRTGEWIFDLVFILVVVFTLVQAPTLPWFARRLGLTEEAHSVELDVEATPLTDLGADILSVSVGPHSRLHGVEVLELRLPPTANLTLVVRGTERFVPDLTTSIRHGDQLLIVCPESELERISARMRAVSEHGRLAGWN
ncbi:potassium/proton antiporter [Actinomycetota bacterium]